MIYTLGFSAPLSSTPYQSQVARLRVEQLQIEEERLQHLRTKETDERRKGTVDRFAFCLELIRFLPMCVCIVTQLKEN